VNERKVFDSRVAVDSTIFPIDFLFLFCVEGHFRGFRGISLRPSNTSA
jgi:hypothetical protein